MKRYLVESAAIRRTSRRSKSAPEKRACLPSSRETATVWVSFPWLPSAAMPAWIPSA